jgi:uncharacterized protein YjdB
MKKILKTTVLLIPFLLFACENPANKPDDKGGIPAGVGEVYLTIDVSDGRTLFPSGWETFYYGVRFTAAGKTAVTAALTGAAGNVTLEAGIWKIDIEAKSGNTVVGTASVSNVQVSEGKTTEVKSVRILPVTGGADGTVQWSVVLPDAITDATLLYHDADESNGGQINLLDAPSGTVNLAPGSWWFRAELEDKFTGGKGEAVQVYSGLTTSIDWQFPDISVRVTSVTVNGGNITLMVGDHENLDVTILPADAANSNVTWSSSNAGTARVSQSGQVTAVTDGTAIITATAQDGSGKAGSITVMVTSPVAGAPGLVHSVTIDDGDFTLMKGETGDITATVLPENAVNKNLTWSSSAPAIATVSSNGQGATVTAVAEGTATITATAADGSGKTDYITVTVMAESVRWHWNFRDPVIPGWTNYATNGSQAMNTNAVYHDGMTLLGAQRNTRWMPDQNIPSGGSALGFTQGCIQTGGATASGSYFLQIANVQGPFEITVNYTGTGGTQSGRYPVLYINGSSVKNGDGTNNTDPFVLSHNYTGTDTVTVQMGCNEGIRIFDVIIVSGAASVPISSITISGGNFSLSAGNTRQLSATIQPGNASNKNVTWASNATGRATVNDNGLVTAVSAGTATITATAQDGSGRFGSVTVTVTAAKQVESVTITDGNFSLATGGTRTLTANVLPADAANKNLTWSSSNTGRATVSTSGVVTAGSTTGTATITATAADGSGKSASVTVTVTAASNIAMTPQEIFQSLKGTKAVTNGWADRYNNGAGVTYANPSSLTLIEGTDNSTKLAAFTAAVNRSSGGDSFVILSGDLDLSNGKITDSDKSYFDQFDTTSPYARKNGDINVNVRSNTTIIGINNARIKFGGLNITTINSVPQFNIIIRNVEFWDAHGSTENDTTYDTESKASADQLNIQRDATGIWIDHCKFSDGTCNDMTRNLNHDGALDIAAGTNITVSYCEFTNHDKVTLIGSSDSATDVSQRTVTFHHNYYHATTQRMPRARGTQTHLYNNYFDNIGVNGNSGYIMGPGRNSQFIVENNYFGSRFHNTNTKIFDYYDNTTYPSKVYSNGNNSNNGTGSGNGNVSSRPWTPAYSFTLDAVSGLNTSVPAGAGPTLTFMK